MTPFERAQSCFREPTASRQERIAMVADAIARAVEEERAACAKIVEAAQSSFRTKRACSLTAIQIMDRTQ